MDNIELRVRNGAMNIPVSVAYCKKLIRSHPDYPSLLSIADTLERLGIRYKAMKIKKDRLSGVKRPFLLWPNKQSRQLQIVRDVQDLPVNGTEDLTHKETEQTIVLLVKSTNTIRDDENNHQLSQYHFRKLLTVLLGTSLTPLILLAVMPDFSWSYALLLVSALAGAVAGFLLIARDVGINYQLVEEFCLSGRKTNCDAVMNTEAAQLLGDKITFSDIAIIYFLFQFILVNFRLPSAPSFLGILAILSGLTIPIIAYSLYYQAFSIKTWCRLCLIVDAVLVLQAVLFGYMYTNVFIAVSNIWLQQLVQSGLIFLSITSAFLLLKHIIKEANQSEQVAIEANRIKHSPKVFMYLLRREKRVNTTPFEKELIIGNPDAPVHIIMAASLGCKPCKIGFKKAAKLVKTYPNKLKLAIRLRTGSRNNGNQTLGTYLLSYWLEYIYANSDAPTQTEKLLCDWYDKMDIEAFREEYSLEIHEKSKAINQLADQHAEWFESAEIKSTPTFFIQGWQLPHPYGINDITAMIPALAVQFRRKQIQSNLNAMYEK